MSKTFPGLVRRLSSALFRRPCATASNSVSVYGLVLTCLSKHTVHFANAILIAWLAFTPLWAQNSALTISPKSAHPEIRYVSGKNVYVEALTDQHWIARNWSFESSKTTAMCDFPAFQLTIQTQPSSGFDRGIELSTWKFVRAKELPKTSRGADRGLPLGGTPVGRAWNVRHRLFLQTRCFLGRLV